MVWGVMFTPSVQESHISRMGHFLWVCCWASQWKKSFWRVCATNQVIWSHPNISCSSNLQSEPIYYSKRHPQIRSCFIGFAGRCLLLRTWHEFPLLCLGARRRKIIINLQALAFESLFAWVKIPSHALLSVCCMGSMRTKLIKQRWYQCFLVIARHAASPSGVAGVAFNLRWPATSPALCLPCQFTPERKDRRFKWNVIHSLEKTRIRSNLEFDKKTKQNKTQLLLLFSLFFAH